MTWLHRHSFHAITDHQLFFSFFSLFGSPGTKFILVSSVQKYFTELCKLCFLAKPNLPFPFLSLTSGLHFVVKPSVFTFMTASEVIFLTTDRIPHVSCVSSSLWLHSLLIWPFFSDGLLHLHWHLCGPHIESSSKQPPNTSSTFESTPDFF